MVQHFVAVGPKNKKVGVVSPSYWDFVQKCSRKFNLNVEHIYISLDDGTEVDEEYFEVIQNGTNLHVKTRDKDDERQESLHQLASFLHKCLLNQPKIHDKVTECLQKPELAPHILGLMAQVAESSSSPSKKEDDLDWFRGLNTKCKTKEAVMRNSAEARMRGYLDKTKKVLLTDDLPSDSPCRKAVQFFKDQLSKDRYNANYFDRVASSDDRLCDGNGLFECEGLYNRPKCEYLHSINPYHSREARIVFSTWNLDHIIEKSRTILPILKSSLEGPRSSLVNLHYFHSLLFLHKRRRGGRKSGNLKLVHVACHDKKIHEIQCDSREIFLKNDVLSPKHNSRDTSIDATDGVGTQPHGCIGVVTRQRSMSNGRDIRFHKDKVVRSSLHSRLKGGSITKSKRKCARKILADRQMKSGSSRNNRWQNGVNGILKN